MEKINFENVDIINELIDIDDELRDVEDSYLDFWLQEGMPDGTTTGEIIDHYFIDDVKEWVRLGKRLLQLREENPEED